MLVFSLSLVRSWRVYIASIVDFPTNSLRFLRCGAPLACVSLKVSKTSGPSCKQSSDRVFGGVGFRVLQA